MIRVVAGLVLLVLGEGSVNLRDEGILVVEQQAVTAGNGSHLEFIFK